MICHDKKGSSLPYETFCLIYFHAGYEDGKVGIWRWMIVKNCEELKKRFVRCVALTFNYSATS